MKVLIATLLSFAMVFSGCSAAKPNASSLPKTSPEAINIQLGAEPDSLDPAFAVRPDEQSYLLHLYEGLTTLSDNLEAASGVAASWSAEADDNGFLSYTFVLDGGARWSDGEQVKAEDFIYAWTRLLDPETDSPNAYKLYPIRGARAFHNGKTKSADENADAGSESGASSGSASSSSTSPSSTSSSSTSSGEDDGEEQPKENPNGLGLSVGEKGELIVELELDCPDFLQRLADPAWFPLRSEVVEKNPTGWQYDADNLITNGAYTMTDWQRDQNIAMERSRYYRKVNAIKAEKLNFILSDDADAMLAALKSAGIQLAVTLPQMELETAGEQLQNNVLLGGYSLMMNTNSKTLNDARVRRALSLALDRTALCKTMRDNSVPATGLIPPGAVSEGIDLRKLGGDLLDPTPKTAEAVRLLSEAGYPNGAGLPAISYLVADQPAHLRMAQAIADCWNALGVQVELLTVKWDEYEVRCIDARYDVTHLTLFSDTLYPSVFLDSWTSDSTANSEIYGSHSYDVLVDMGHGRQPRPEPVPETSGDESKDEGAAGDETDDKANDGENEKPADDAEQGEQAEQDKDDAKTPQQYMSEAERLLVAEDCVVAPIGWYTNSYLTCDEGLRGFKSYPTGWMYFGEASYTKPARG